MTRRESLAWLLGAPWLLAAGGCGREAKAPSLPPGELVGASDALGHRLRAGPPAVRPPDGAWRDLDVLIVGGGVAGLAAAWRLEHAGLHDFVLLELEPALGGTSRSGRSVVCPYPWGAHYLPLPRKQNRALVRLLEELGALEGTDPDGEPVASELLLCREPQERLFYGDRWQEGLFPLDGASPEDLRQLKSFQAEVDRWVGWRDGRGRRAFDLPVAACSDDAEATALDQESMAEWLDRRGLASPRLRWYVEYACRDDYGARLSDTSAWAGLFYFASRRRRPGAEPQPLLVWPEGNGRIVRHLAGRAGERARAGWMAENLVPLAPTAEPVSPEARVEAWATNERGERIGYRARRVIFAAPQFLAHFLLAPYRLEPPAHLAAVEYGPWLVANLHLRDRPRAAGAPLAWDNVLYDSPSLGYVVATHQTESDRGPTVFTYYHALCDQPPRAAREKLLATGREAWAEAVLADLGRAHPDLPGLVERLDVLRWGHAMIRPRPGFVWSQARRRAREPFRGIHFANTDLSGVALFEEAFHHGLRAAEEVLRALGREVADPWALPD
ncbi:MAG: FAD-dependent oxidoreductase [Planctomycetes bacterium]|nr:FAD-dependent oxidoreductase [Planctomycetota bacterium]